MKPYVFATTCVDADGESIRQMVDDPHAVQVSYATMRAKCAGLVEWSESVGYVRHPRQGHGLTLQRDWAVSFHKGFYRGRPCYWVEWSRIEHIWVLQGVSDGAHA